MSMQTCSWLRITLGPCKFSLRGALIVSALTYLATPTVATAAPITYVLDPPVTVIGGSAPTIFGSFIFDAAGPKLEAVDISIKSGSQTQFYTVPVSSSANGILAEIPNTSDMMLLIFTNPIGLTPDPVSGVGFPRDPIPAISGDAVPLIPEPASLALLCGAVGLFFLTRRVNWGVHSA